MEKSITAKTMKYGLNIKGWVSSVMYVSITLKIHIKRKQKEWISIMCKETKKEGQRRSLPGWRITMDLKKKKKKKMTTIIGGYADKGWWKLLEIIAGKKNVREKDKKEKKRKKEEGKTWWKLQGHPWLRKGLTVGINCLWICLAVKIFNHEESPKKPMAHGPRWFLCFSSRAFPLRFLRLSLPSSGFILSAKLVLLFPNSHLV